MSDILDKIGKNVLTYRQTKAITQEELSSLCGLHRNYIASVEKGKRNISLKTLEKIAKGLNVSVIKLLE